MKKSKIIAIHQPNFFPWLGYFNKISLSDTFIIMDNAQFPKTGGTWSNRVRLLVSDQANWVTMPIIRNYHGKRDYSEMLINNKEPWQIKIIKTIQNNYQKTPFFKEIFPFISDLINYPTDSLLEYNLFSIYALTEALKMDSNKLIQGSKLAVTGNSTELLISMTQSVGGTAYLCGSGASGYQEDEKFTEAGLDLIYQNFQHPHYPQLNQSEFIPGLSIIDALMNCGFEQTRCLINNS